MTRNAPSPDMPRGFEPHDHATCVHTALRSAADTCAEQKLRLTPVRRKVLEILLREHRALGAYAILDLLKDEGFGSQPPVAYRALEFLVENGFAHRIERLNAYVACAHPGQTHAPAFMICRLCDTVAETGALPPNEALGTAAKAAGFTIERAVVEAEGICPTCKDKTPA